MIQALNTIKGRVIVVLVVFLSLAHAMGLWLYAQRTDMTAGLLHDALLADCIAAITKLADGAAPSSRPALLANVSGPLLHFSMSEPPAILQTLPEGTRLHSFEHMLSAFLGRPLPDGVNVTYSLGDAGETQSLLAAMDDAGHAEVSHIPERPLAEIHAKGTISTRVRLADGTWMEARSPLLSLNPYSVWKFGAALGAMLTSVLLVAGWALHRWTQPLTYFAAAAQRLGADINSPALNEHGPTEVAAAARAFNHMQERIRVLIEDRSALAAAIAHDLGTPLTRVRLKVEEVGDAAARTSILQDLEQMQRMVSSTIAFARLDLTEEPPDNFDLVSVVERVADDLDLGAGRVEIDAPATLVIRSRPSAIQRALCNVVENALKYGQRATIRVAEQPDSISITVDDAGPGIPDHLHKDVFAPFRRLPPSGPTVDGTGLGLTVARSLMRGLGGEVTLANLPTGGLRVTISFPRDRAPPRAV